MLLAPLLVVSGLAAGCGDPQTVESGALSGSDAFTVSGDVGSAPEVEWKGRMTAGEEPETDVVTTGDGAELAADETVLVNYWVGNGYTRSTALDTYTAEDLPDAFPVGGQPAQPASQEPSEAEIARYLLDAFVAGQVEAGDTVGTRKVVTVSSAAVVGFSGGSLGIGNTDGLVFVLDITGVPLAGPQGTSQPRKPEWPNIHIEKKVPASLNFAGATPPDGKLHTYTYLEGDGAAVKKDDLIVVDYLGQVYQGDKPFDDSYSRGTPFTTPIGKGAVVKGWDQGLVGVTVGSRVVLEIPPALGYGKDGSGDAIPGGSTLYFVVDVLAAG